MSLEKQLIVDNETVISAKLLNDMQDAIIDNESQIELSKNKLNSVSAVNLLDNSDFRHPIGQAGLGDGVYHGSDIYPADRWREWTPGTTHHFDPITGLTTSENCTFAQVVDAQFNNPYTIALGFSDGTVLTANGVLSTENSISIGNSNGIARLYISGGVTYFAIGFCVNCIWAALYEGSYTAETLPPYAPKGYAAELLACNIAETGRVHDSDKLDGKDASLYLNKDDNDYIVDQGTSGIWGYRKWNSGLAECWFFVRHQIDSFEVEWGSLYESDEYFPTYEFPFHIYSIKSEALCPTSGLGIITAQRARNENAQASPPLIFMRPMKTTSGCSVRVGYYMIGTWKE